MNRPARLALSLGLGLLALFATGCPGPSAPRDAGGGLDAATPDAGPDAGSRCAGDGDCAGATPICELGSGECVECTTDAHCAAEAPLCDTSARVCVACRSDEDCPDPDLPRCDPGASVCVAGCVAGGCARFAGLGRGACGLAETCVECSAGEASACGAGVTCDLTTETCAGAPPASVGVCEACTNDEQCPADHRCVMTRYLGEPDGHYCLRRARAGAGCERPFFVNARGRNSINGADPENYCGPAEERTTCAAMLAVDEPCGAGCPLGGRCELIAGSGTVCTYDCASDLECPATILQIGTCGDTETYCGGA